MKGLTDIRDRTLVMLRALGVEPTDKQMRVVERYVRWVDQQVSDAHIDGRAMDREIVGGHEMVVTHEGLLGGPDYAVHCHEPEGANCRLVCADGCEDWGDVYRENGLGFHTVTALRGTLIGRHLMHDAGYCNVSTWLNEGYNCGADELCSKPETFEIGRFPIKPVWTGHGFEWERLP